MAVQLSGQPSGDGVGAVVNKVFRTTLRLAGSVAEGSYRVLSEPFMGVVAGPKNGFYVLYLRY
jgi:hypothetical protein